jgi:hypothetical protein
MTQLLIAFAALIAAFQGAPQRPASSASVEGIVVKLGTGEALANATVQLTVEFDGELSGWNIGAQGRRTLKSDPNGRFIFERVIPGEYRLIATYEGEYVPAEYGQRSPTGAGIPFEVAAGQKLTGIQLAMAPTGAISGRIYDRYGEPLAKAQVFALRPAYTNGRRRLTIVQSAESNDRGEYRLFWLAPGSYYIGALADIPERPLNIAAARITPASRFGTYQQGANPVVHKRTLRTGEVVEEMYLPIYYPNAIDMNAATSVSVATGTTVGGVDLATGAALIRPHHIRGKVIDQATGQPLAGVYLQAVPRIAGPFYAIPHAQANADGSFDIPGVIPGSYQILASAHSSAQSLDGFAAVQVSEKDVENIPIVMTSGFKLSGRFLLEGRVQSGNNSRLSFPVVSVARDAEVMDMPTGFISRNLTMANPDGSFTIPSVPPGAFRVVLRRLPVDSYVKSIRMGAADVLNDGFQVSGPPDSALEIVLGTNAGIIEGSVVNSRNEAVANRTVVLVPEVRLRQRDDLFKVAFTNSAGRFRIHDIAPGDYKLFAWENVERGAWQDPNFLQAYENAGRPIRINEGSDESLQLPVIP